MRPSASHSLSTLSAWYALLGSVNRTTTTFSISAILASLRSNNLVEPDTRGPRCQAPATRRAAAAATACALSQKGPRRGRGASFTCTFVGGRTLRKRALAHPEASLVDRGRRLQLELAVDHAHRCVEREQERVVPAASSSPLTCTRSVSQSGDARRPEPHLRMQRDDEEVGRSEMLVALGDARVDARRVDRQLDLRATWADDVRAVEAAEAAANRMQAPQVLDLELDRRPGGIERSTARPSPPSR